MISSALFTFGADLRSWWTCWCQRQELLKVKLRWVKVESFKKWNGTATCTPRFQDLHEDEYVEEDNARSWKAWLLRTRYVVSRAWIPADHPDAERVQSKTLVRELTKCDSAKCWERVMGCHNVVFREYSNFLQGDDRTEEEKDLFAKALKDMNLLYGCSLFRVLVIPDFSGYALREAGLALHRSAVARTRSSTSPRRTFGM